MTALQTISRKHFVLKSRLDDARMRYQGLSLSVGEAKARIEADPQVRDILEELQRREHERAVGAYEELLTLFLRDVLPGHREVVMDLRTERSLPALDVSLRKGPEMPLEDALSGTGGSVTNILSAGLRFISLVRSGKRPFMVLDEPDCWIKPELAPKFAAVVQSVAEQLGVQVLMISHHDEQMFDRILPHRLRLEKNGTQLMAQWAPSSTQPDWEEGQSGLRSIELVNFQSHAHTIIPLSPGLTLINGDNDIGKSAIVSALRAVFDADSNEQHIRHGAKSAKVILDFGPDNILSWERLRKGSHKVAYQLIDPHANANQEPLRKSTSAREAPEWVQELGIGLIDGMDVQLANQKDPVFLLNKPPRDRARALAVGGENAHVQEMLKLAKKELDDARSQVRTGEREMETLHRTRQVLEPLEKRDDIITQLEQQQQKLAQTQELMQRARQLLERWQSTRHHRNLLQGFTGEMPLLPEAPHNDRGERELAQRWKKAQQQKGALTPLEAKAPLEIPALEIPEKIQELAKRWKKSQIARDALSPLQETFFPDMPLVPAVADGVLLEQWHKAQARKRALSPLALTPLPPPPTLLEEQVLGMRHVAQRWVQALQGKSQQSKLLEEDERDLNQIQQQLDAQKECPTCGQSLDHLHSLRD